MKYLVVAPQLGFTTQGEIIPGGLLQFGRCVVRALASSPDITKLSIYCQVDPCGVEPQIRDMVSFHSNPALELDVQCFGGNEIKISHKVMWACLHHAFDRVMYLLINQSILNIIPFHLPYDVWEIGEELFHPTSWLKYRALQRASRLLSISENTSQEARHWNPGIPEAKIVHLCVEPPLSAPFIEEKEEHLPVYQASYREPAVLIVGNMHKGLMYKGHQQLIDAWKQIVDAYPNAELWIVGDGDCKLSLEQQVKEESTRISQRIFFWGRVDNQKLIELYQRCRIFAMPSKREGFGLVFIEAARYGVPCIGGKHDSVKEILIDNQTGLLVEQTPQDIATGIIRLLVDDQFANQLGQAGQKRYLDNYQFSHFRARLLNTLELSI